MFTRTSSSKVITVIGFDMRVVRNGCVKGSVQFPKIEGGDTVFYFPPTSLNHMPVDPFQLIRDHAVEVICQNGYPLLFSMRAGDFPRQLNIPADEIVHVVSWDQS